MLFLILLLLVAGLALLWFSRRQRAAAGLPAGRVVYSDTRRGDRVEIPLYSERHRLAGKPDYLIEENGRFTPVEVKSSGGTFDGPYDSHVYQLGVYCLLVEETYGVRPARGILRYPGKTFEVAYTPELEAAVLQLLAEMRAVDEAVGAGRSHESHRRCRACGYRGACNQSLVRV